MTQAISTNYELLAEYVEFLHRLSNDYPEDSFYSLLGESKKFIMSKKKQIEEFDKFCKPFQEIDAYGLAMSTLAKHLDSEGFKSASEKAMFFASEYCI